MVKEGCFERWPFVKLFTILDRGTIVLCDILDFSYDQLLTFYMGTFRLWLFIRSTFDFYMVSFRLFIWSTFDFLYGKLLPFYMVNSTVFTFNVKLKNQSRLQCARPKQSSPSSNPTRMIPLQISDHLVQNWQIGEQMTHWDMLNKATKFEFFSVPVRHLLSSLAICTTWSFRAHNGSKPHQRTQWTRFVYIFLLLLSTASSFEETERCNNLSFEDNDQTADTIHFIISDIGDNGDFPDVTSILKLTVIKDCDKGEEFDRPATKI